MLLLLGTDFAWNQFYPDHATIIQVDADPTHIGRRHPVTIGVVGNIKTPSRRSCHGSGNTMTRPF